MNFIGHCIERRIEPGKDVQSDIKHGAHYISVLASYYFSIRKEKQNRQTEIFKSMCTLSYYKRKEVIIRIREDEGQNILDSIENTI